MLLGKAEIEETGLSNVVSKGTRQKGEGGVMQGGSSLGRPSLGHYPCSKKYPETFRWILGPVGLLGSGRAWSRRTGACQLVESGNLKGPKLSGLARSGRACSVWERSGLVGPTHLRQVKRMARQMTDGDTIEEMAGHLDPSGHAIALRTKPQPYGGAGVVPKCVGLRAATI